MKALKVAWAHMPGPRRPLRTASTASTTPKANRLTTTDLGKLDKRADVDKEDPEVVADSWVKDHGFS